MTVRGGKGRIWLTVAAALALAVSLTTIIVQRASSPDITIGRPADLNAAIASIDAAVPGALASAHVPGAEVAIAVDGALVWQAGYGFTTPGGAEVGPGTAFQVGSISKPVAAATLLDLAGDGITLDQPVASSLKSWQLPAATPQPDAITVRHLLSHTAGINEPGYLGLPPGGPMPTTAQSLQGASTGNAVAQTGKPGRYEYSGGGITIAQLVAEDTTTRAFSSLVKTHVLDPIGMSHSGFGCTTSGTVTANTAVGHDHNGVPTPVYRYAETAAAGLCSTAGDLAKFGGWLASDDARAKLMRSPADGTDGHYGLGVEINGPAAVGHIGVNRGFYSRLFINPKDHVVLVVITNGDNGRVVVDTVLQAWHSG